MPSISESLSPEPDRNSLAYWLAAPFKGYIKRQGQMARDASAAADDGAERVRRGDLSGLASMLLGPIGWASSPISALIPTQDEAYASFDGNTAPLVAGGLEAAAMFLPGSKRGLKPAQLKKLVEDAEAERTREAFERQFTGGQSAQVPSAPATQVPAVVDPRQKALADLLAEAQADRTAKTFKRQFGN